MDKIKAGRELRHFAQDVKELNPQEGCIFTRIEIRLLAQDFRRRGLVVENLKPGLTEAARSLDEAAGLLEMH